MSATHPTESSPHATATVSPDSDGPKSLASGQAATGTWLVAYGIGAPVLFLTQSGVADALRKTGAARSIALTFLVGVSVQVLSALLYKTTMWQLYMGELSPAVRNTRFHKACEWISKAFWLEFAFDAAAIGLFGWATWRTVLILT